MHEDNLNEYRLSDQGKFSFVTMKSDTEIPMWVFSLFTYISPTTGQPVCFYSNKRKTDIKLMNVKHTDFDEHGKEFIRDEFVKALSNFNAIDTVQNNANKNVYMLLSS